ncbi:MAG TPA: CHC2 zinc finger domain-containing protein, partial [Candidatus Paceibacterota bacterium]
MESTVEIIKSKLTIADVVGSYIKLEKAGINMKARCPFHNERTPSFFISPERGTFHCFGCNRGGDIFTFVEEIESIEFKEALRVLADRSGVSLNKDMGQFSGTGKIRAALIEAVNFYRNQLTKSVECNQYLKDRGLEQFSIEKFQIGFAPKAWRALSEHLRRKGIAETDAEKAGLLV